MIHDEKTRRLLHLARQARPHPARQVRGAQRADAGRASWSAAIPMSFLMARARCPTASCEYDVIGGIRGAPVDVVKAQAYRPAGPRQCRDRHRRLRPAGQRQGRGPVRRVDRLLRERRARRAGARHQGDLLPQQPDHARLPAAAPARRTRALPRGDALGLVAREHRQGRRARRRRRLGARDRHGAARSSASRSSSAIPATRPRPATSPRCAMSAPIPAAMSSSSMTISIPRTSTS